MLKIKLLDKNNNFNIFVSDFQSIKYLIILIY